MGTPSHLGHMDRVAATMPSQAHAGAAQEAPDIGQWEGQDVPLVRPSSCNVKGGIPSSRRYLPTYLGVAWLGAVACLLGSRCAALRLCDCLSAPPPFFFRWARIRGWAGVPAGVFFWGKVYLFLPLPSLGWCTHWSAFGVANWWLLVLQLAASRAPAPWVGWVMYTLGLEACPVGLGSGFAGSAVAPAGFERSWVKGGWGCLDPTAFGVPVVTFWWRFMRAGCRRWGSGFTEGRAVASSPCVVGWCGVVPRLWVHLLAFRGVRRFARVTPSVGVPCFGAVACFGALRCVVLCFAVLCRGDLWRVAVRSALSCRAAPCLAVVCLALA